MNQDLQQAAVKKKVYKVRLKLLFQCVRHIFCDNFITSVCWRYQALGFIHGLWLIAKYVKCVLCWNNLSFNQFVDWQEIVKNFDHFSCSKHQCFLLLKFKHVLFHCLHQLAAVLSLVWCRPGSVHCLLKSVHASSMPAADGNRLMRAL